MIRKFLLILLTTIYLLPSTPVLAQEFSSNSVTTEVGETSAVAAPSGVCDGNSTEAVLKKELLTNFNLTMEGFSKLQLTWACQKLAEISSRSKLTQLLKKFPDQEYGVYIKMVDDSPNKYSSMNGCSAFPSAGLTTVSLHPHPTQAMFTMTLLHELGHVTQDCLPKALVLYTKFDNMFENPLAPLTAYSRAPQCTGFAQNVREKRRNESFAEMTTYYHHHVSQERPITNCPPDNLVPYNKMRDDANFRGYFDFANELFGAYP